MVSCFWHLWGMVCLCADHCHPSSLESKWNGRSNVSGWLINNAGQTAIDSPFLSTICCCSPDGEKLTLFLAMAHKVFQVICGWVSPTIMKFFFCFAGRYCTIENMIHANLSLTPVMPKNMKTAVQYTFERSIFFFNPFTPKNDRFQVSLAPH